MSHEFERYCKDYEKIENYEKAKADDFKNWEVHHRLETHNSDGERRLVDITADELKALDMYYNRPASELIFLTSREHHEYRKGKKHSEETKKKMREVKKGEKNPFYGKHHTEESKNKLREAQKGNKYALGCKRSEETRRRMAEVAKGNANVKGTHWYNNGKINIMSKECPPGFTPGRMAEVAKGNTNTKGMHWYNNGKINTMSKECPPGFVPGKIKKL